jgi:formate hydrogenlyase subunit 3/multisubunit Na+/H+ antiporter MnhD subunit
MTALSLVCMLMLLSPQVHGLIAVTRGSLVFEVSDRYMGQRGVVQLERATGPIQIVWGSEDIPTFVVILFGLMIIAATAYYIYKMSQENQKSGDPVNNTTPNSYFTLKINTKPLNHPST